VPSYLKLKGCEGSADDLLGVLLVVGKANPATNLSTPLCTKALGTKSRDWVLDHLFEPIINWLASGRSKSASSWASQHS